MTANGWLQFVVFFAVLLLLMRPLGLYIARVLEGEKTFLDPCSGPRAPTLPRLRHPRRSGNELATILRRHAVFSFVSLLLTYIIERAQALLPWNPQHLAGVAPATAFNTAASFTTNTNWQVYTPETTMSYFTQMADWLITTFSARPSASPSPWPWSAASRASNQPLLATSGSIPHAPSCGSCSPSAW